MADFKEVCNRTYIEAKLCPESIEKWIKFVNEGDETMKGNRTKSVFSLEVKKHLSALGWEFAYATKSGGSKELRYMSPQGKWFCSLVKACMSCVEVEDFRVCKDKVSCLTNNVDKKRKSVRVFGNRKLVKVDEEEEEEELYCPPRVRARNRELVKVKEDEDGVSCGLRDRCSGFEGKERKRIRACVNGRIRELVKVNEEEEDGFSCPPRDRCSDSDSDFEVKKERKRVRVCVNGRNRKSVRVDEEGISCPPRDLCSGFERKRIRVCVNGGSGKLSSTPRNLCSDSEVKKEKEKVRVCGNGGNQELVKVNEEKDGLLSCAPSELSPGINGVRICKSLKKILELMEKKSIAEKNTESLRFSRRRCNGDDHDDDISVKNSDVCSVCYWGGDLLLCDGCPSSYHHTCLGLTTLPKADLWFCPCCCCETCGTMEFNHSKLMTCEQCNRRFHLKCLKEEDQSCVSHNGWFCSNQCERVYSSLQNILGQEFTVGDDDLVWTLLRAPSGYVYDEPCDEQQMSMLRSAVKVLHEGFEPSKDPFSGRDLVEELVLRRDEDCVKLQGFYTVIVKRKKKVISVATVRVGKDVAEIPLVATVSMYRKRGMCRVLMNELEKQMIKIGVCELVLPAAEAVLTTWTKRFGFSEMTSDERLKVVKHGILDFAGTVLCHKSLSNGGFSVESSLTE